MNIMLIPIPIRIPICSGKTKQQIKATKPGIKSVSGDYLLLIIEIKE